MAFSKKSLVRLVNQLAPGLAAGTPKSNSINLFAYATDDAAATVEAGGYFNAARDEGRITLGDIIFASMANSGTPVSKTYVVTAAPASGAVTIALQSTVAG